MTLINASYIFVIFQSWFNGKNGVPNIPNSFSTLYTLLRFPLENKHFLCLYPSPLRKIDWYNQLWAKFPASTHMWSESLHQSCRWKRLLPSHPPKKIAVFSHDGLRTPIIHRMKKTEKRGRGCNSQDWSTRKNPRWQKFTMSSLTWWSSRTIAVDSRSQIDGRSHGSHLP